ncbi:dipeptidyl peptidase 4 isoform X1 [Syngnathus typhle]|uniref:dipeptidyl peptidase 4 isoform X1 n=1 Tax=Syngnathus typhle TaxID=161592 RepID=UPI002A699FF2|nr:dipeptidyl peptidase 4 isoform X1 [Syngnathus typhle]XP_061142591.1 dipeptidyl peptidase 4 isoform X1 [Syngnathus typhle]
MGCGNQLVWALLGATAFITAVTVTAVILSRAHIPRVPYGFDDYFNDTIRWRAYNLYWLTDTTYLHRARDGNVYIYNAEAKTKELYLSNSTFAEVGATDYLLTGDRTHAVLEHNYAKQWRHSYTASYSFFNLDTGVFDKNVTFPPTVQYLSMAPAGKKLAYVHDYNLYLKATVNDKSVQLTKNGKKNEILNGVPDWVYEEEVFASNGALWWSTTTKRLAYMEFDDRKVQKIAYPIFKGAQYPTNVEIPYPKAGTALPRVKLFVVNTDDGHAPKHLIQPPASLRSGDYLLTSVTWVNDNRLAVQWVTRRQNYELVQIYDLEEDKWKDTQKFEHISKTGWVGHYVPSPLFFTEDDIGFYKVLSAANGYKHIHFIHKGKAIPVTSGQWEVIYISKLTKDAIYFVGYEDGDGPMRRHVYRVALGIVPSPRQCLSCHVDKHKCQYNSAYFSTDASYYRMECYGPGLPRFMLVNNRRTGASVPPVILEDNNEIEKTLRKYQMPKMKYGTIKIAGFDLWYEMLLPPNFVSSRKYPLLLDVYGGPCSQRVDYRFKLNWGTFLASTYGIIVAKFDGRGSGYQGDAILHSIYHRLGTIEVEDQITAARKFAEMRFVDEDRIAIWGWSYGGYVSSMALGAGTRVFKCGIAVAPVANWKYYDAVYTERYMGMPQQNKVAYENSTVTARAKHFKSAGYLLLAGTADDNVHFQHAAEISKALVAENVQFESMVNIGSQGSREWYTDKDHSLAGTTKHVYNTMTDFLKKCLVDKKL